MERIKGLNEYVKNEKYRKALNLPNEQEEEYTMLAQGEYNINYSFTHPKTGKKLLLRVNCGSQMHLENQIGYECHALQLLEASGRTPKVLYVDGSRKFLDHGVLVMEYLPGKALDYHTDLKYAAECLADIHSVRIPESESGLIRPENPLIAILEECEEMVKIYMDSPLGKDRMKRKIRDLLDKAWKKAKEFHMEDSPYQCCINTELNSTNFLIGGEGKPNYLIDWEKPLFGDPAQDLGHFLAPTTTFWKTDVILKEEEIENFLNEYLKCVRARFDITGLKERFLYGEYFEYVPQFKVFLAANHKPIIRDTTHSIWRRIKLMPFENTFTEANRDKHFAEKIMAKEMPGILAWAVKGCLLWQQEGIQDPPTVKKATAEYRTEMDSFATFFEECCLVREDGRTSNKMLRSTYDEWCKDNGEYALSQRPFSQKLLEMGFEKKRIAGSGLLEWRGFVLRGQASRL